MEIQGIESQTASPQSHQEHKETQSFSEVSLKENMVAKMIVDCAYKVYKALGAGLLESAYEECLEKEFLKRKVIFKKQYEYPLYYDGEKLNTPYRVDFLIDDCVIVELKSVEKILPIHEAQTLTYLKLSGLKLALLINFSSPLIKDGIRRFVN